jgi:thiol-disulfide isomerase/thioredoxin
MELKILRFGAVWCQPSKVVDSIVNMINEENDNVEYITYDYSDDPDMFSKYKIISVPTLIILDKKDKELEKIRGIFPKIKLTLLIEKYKNENI